MVLTLANNTCLDFGLLKKNHMSFANKIM